MFSVSRIINKTTTPYTWCCYLFAFLTFSLMVHSRGMSESDHNEVGEIVTDLPDGIILKKTMSINNVPLDIPFWLVDGFQGTDYGFFTDSMFERTSVMKVGNSGFEIRTKLFTKNSLGLPKASGLNCM